MTARRELDLLIERWTVLSDDEAVPANTRRVLKICLEDVRTALAAELAAPHELPNEHPLTKQAEGPDA